MTYDDSESAPIEQDEELTFSEWEGADDKFALRVVGDAMIDAHIADGDYVIIQKQDRADTGDIVAIRDVDGESILRRIFYEQGRVRLMTADPGCYPVFRDEVKIIGKLVGVVRKY